MWCGVVGERGDQLRRLLSLHLQDTLVEAPSNHDDCLNNVMNYEIDLKDAGNV